MLSFRPLLVGPTGGWLGKVGRSMSTTRIVFQPSPTPVEAAHKHTDFPVASSSGFVPDVSNIPSANNDDDEVVVPLRALKGKSSRNSVRHFVDWVEVTVCAGDGGDGSISLNSLYANEFAGPDGGDGGSGGHVILTANPAYRDLSHVKSKLIAARGGAGKSNKCEGKDAQHLVVQVPVGTILRNLEGALIADLDRDGVSFIAARGGAGGKGNTYFKSSTRRKPEIAEVGGQGERLEYTLELRTMADVGLIGFPNAGKSTLLTAISRARPKVAAYPFTTLNPHIGMVQYSDLTQLAVADLPGLLPGAHKNHGLGIAFLRHIERCSLLLYVLDMGEEEPWKQLGQLKFELDAYSPGLSSRPSAVIANKMDLEESGGRLTQLEEYLGNDATIIPISGKMGDNLTHLLVLIKHLHDDYVAMHQDHVQV